MSRPSAGREVLVRRAGVSVVLAQVALWAWLTVRGYFYLDDFELAGRAADASRPSADYLLAPHRGVVTPGARLVAWALTEVAPLSWAATAAALVAGQALVGLLALHVLRSLVGDVLALLPALVVAVLSPVGLPGALWWSTGLLQLPQHLALLGSLALALRWLRDGRATAAVGSALAVGAGALFSPRALLAAPFVLAVSATHLCDGTARARLATLLRRWPLWGAHLVVVTLAVLAWWRWGGARLVAVPSPRSVVEIGAEGLFHAVLPGLVGGPWSWLPTGYAGAVAAPGPVGVLAGLALTAVVVALTVAWWRGAAAAWWVVAGYLVASVAWVAAGPDSAFGALVGDDYRTQGDLGLVAGIGLALATAPVVAGVRGRVPRSLLPRPEGRAALRRTVLEPSRAAGALPRRPGATGALAAVAGAGLLASSALASTITYAPSWVGNPAGAVVRTTLADLRSLPPDARVLDATVPDQVATPLIRPWNTTFTVLGPVLDARAELRPGTAAPLAVMADRQGRLRRVAVLGAVAAAGPDPGCGWRVGTTARRIPFRGASGSAPVIRLGVLAPRATTLELVAGGRTASVALPAGLGSAFTVTEGPVHEVTVRTVPDGTEVCVGDGQAGSAEPLPGTEP